MGKDTVVSQFHWGMIRKDYLVVVQAGDQPNLGGHELGFVGVVDCFDFCLMAR